MENTQVATMSDEEVAIALRKQANEQNKNMNRAMVILFVIALLYTILPDLFLVQWMMLRLMGL